MKATLEGNELVIRIPANTTNLPLSKTGKTRIVASSGGNKQTDAKVDGCPIIVGINAYIKH